MYSGKKLSIHLGRLTAAPWFGYSLIVCIWLFACFWNFGKAFHIDDTGHLEIARWIAANPLRPMSGMLSWGEDFQPIHFTNQPHLYFYLMAIWGSLFGWTEASMHMLMSLFAFWAIYAFYRIVRFIHPEFAILPTALFALSPAFVVGQNSMVDIPLLAVWTGFYWALLNPKISERNRYLISAMLCSAALLIKYSSLILLPALVLHMILRKQNRQLVWGLLPLIALAIWSAFNFYDYGGIHILGREIGKYQNQSYLQFAVSWLRTLGSITPFAVLAIIAMIYRSTSIISKSAWFLISIFNLLAYSFVLWFFIASPSNDVAINYVLKWLFLINGAALIWIIATMSIKRLINGNLNIVQLTLLYWLVSSALFIIFFAPFMAIRHVLLVIPPVVLLLSSWVMVENKARKFVSAIVVLSLMVTSLLAMADRWYADIYRQQAALIANSMPRQSAIWFNGNWGWQWYASQSGMRQFSLLDDRPKPRPGDFIVSARVCCALPIPKEIELEPYKKITIPRDSRVSHFASWRLYFSGHQPWGYSNSPIEEFVIWRVLDVRGSALHNG